MRANLVCKLYYLAKMLGHIFLLVKILEAELKPSDGQIWQLMEQPIRLTLSAVQRLAEKAPDEIFPHSKLKEKNVGIFPLFET